MAAKNHALVGIILPLCLCACGSSEGGTSRHIPGNITFSDTSTLTVEGPSMRFKHYVEPQKDFEIGFYQHGPTWYTKGGIIELWIGDINSAESVLSVRSADGSRGAGIDARNAGDTDSMEMAFGGTEGHEFGLLRTRGNTPGGHPIVIQPSNGELFIDSAMYLREGVSPAARQGFAVLYVDELGNVKVKLSNGTERTLMVSP